MRPFSLYIHPFVKENIIEYFPFIKEGVIFVKKSKNERYNKKYNN